MVKIYSNGDSWEGKIGYLDETLPMPSSDDPSYLEWDVQNSIVMAWLIHSMEEKISDTYLLFNCEGDLG